MKNVVRAGYERVNEKGMKMRGKGTKEKRYTERRKLRKRASRKLAVLDALQMEDEGEGQKKKKKKKKRRRPKDSPPAPESHEPITTPDLSIHVLYLTDAISFSPPLQKMVLSFNTEECGIEHIWYVLMV